VREAQDNNLYFIFERHERLKKKIRTHTLAKKAKECPLIPKRGKKRTSLNP